MKDEIETVLLLSAVEQPIGPVGLRSTFGGFLNENETLLVFW